MRNERQTQMHLYRFATTLVYRLEDLNVLNIP
jgi:hypothetical protein